MPEGHIRGLSQYYADGLERMEIGIDKRYALPLPYQDGLRIPIRLKVGTSYYEAGLRATTPMPVVWVSPDLKDSDGRKISLARVLENNGFRKNQKVSLNVDGNVVHVLPLP